jgi:PBSX family phage terminase large subunit
MSTELIHHFKPRGAAAELMRYRGTEALIAGPAGTGKSRAALEKIHLMALLNPEMSGLILRKTANSLTSSAVATFERDVAAQALLDGTVKFFGGSSREPAQYRYSNGSHIALGGMDNPLKIMSTERDVIFVQEATELTTDDWEMATTRLRNGKVSFQQLIADCNPQDPMHWLKLRCEAGATTMLHSKHEDNPRYFNTDGTMTEEGASYIARLDALTGVRYLRLRKGIWAAAEGVIYEDFNPAVHLVDCFEIPEQWRRIWSVDFGYVHPFVWQDWAIGPDGEMILVREIYRTQTLVEDHARVIRRVLGLGPIDPLTGRPQPYAGPEVTGWDAKRPSIILCDHDAEDRATLERHIGWPTRPASKNVGDGIQATSARFRLDGRGRARVKMFRDAVVGGRDPELVDAKRPASTPEEIPTYVWNDKGKDEPRKEMDDGSDTLRYTVMEVDVQPQPRVRSM